MSWLRFHVLCLVSHHNLKLSLMTEVLWWSNSAIFASNLINLPLSPSLSLGWLTVFNAHVQIQFQQIEFSVTFNIHRKLSTNHNTKIKYDILTRAHDLEFWFCMSVFENHLHRMQKAWCGIYYGIVTVECLKNNNVSDLISVSSLSPGHVSILFSSQQQTSSCWHRQRSKSWQTRWRKWWRCPQWPEK